MIQNFKHKGLKQLYETGKTKLLEKAVVPKIDVVLTVLKLPGLHPLQASVDTQIRPPVDT